MRRGRWEGRGGFATKKHEKSQKESSVRAAREKKFEIDGPMFWPEVRKT
jgi:hypothetical protein